MGAGKRKRVSAIVTDTPVKNALEEEQKGAKQKKAKELERKLKSQAKKALFQKESRSNGSMKLTKSTAVGLKRKKEPMEDDDDEDDDEDEEDEDPLCLRCLKPFSNSQPGAQWIQCTNCKHWAQQTCVKNEIRGLFYECYNCVDPLDVDSD
ncbi:parathymosin-like [Schistocerca serialis cubense]|uniref:parathymosin-like n=1 Tax=Schistocerca serialis cubense TaxID=2023355 RepID=UPI00214DF3F2|nr:parathymosin-like [Schistocerca serialis cubense]